jgi:hypothetical protein
MQIFSYTPCPLDSRLCKSKRTYDLVHVQGKRDKWLGDFVKSALILKANLHKVKLHKVEILFEPISHLVINKDYKGFLISVTFVSHVLKSTLAQQHL